MMRLSRRPRRGNMSLRWSTKPSRSPWRITPRVECLDARLLLATSSHTLGPYIAPAAVRPRITHPIIQQNAQAAINNYLAAVLGEAQLVPIENHVHSRQTGTLVPLAQ